MKCAYESIKAVSDMFDSEENNRVLLNSWATFATMKTQVNTVKTDSNIMK
jgi:hypothetical protein